jgi:hypothetical protein
LIFMSPLKATVETIAQLPYRHEFPRLQPALQGLGLGKGN